MNLRRNLSNTSRRRHSGGFILVVGLLFMLVLLLLSAAMFRSFGVQEKIAGNTRDKQRSFEAAQGALQYGEWWLSQGNASTAVACTATGVAIGSLAVCTTALATPAQMPWPASTNYQPPNMTVQAGGGVVANGDINYQATPGLYISYLGLTPDSLGSLYQVNAYGMGGSYETQSVVQSTYRMQTGVKPLDQQ